MTEETKMIYDGLWKCRDLEIQMLWTRLTLLGTFMALTYTGYGVLILKIVDGIKHWNVFNLLAVAAGLFGIVFSVLWIATAKGSKGWFERYEAMITRMQDECGKELMGGNKKSDNSIMSYLEYDSEKIAPYLAPIDSSLFTQCAGRFSVSRIPIVMGQVSLFGWGLIILGHTWCLIAERDHMRLIVDFLGAKIVYVGIVAVCFVASIIWHKVRSESL